MNKITNLLCVAALLLGNDVSALRITTHYVAITAYSSHVAQTDSTPNITATGTRTRVGVVAMSRDLIRLYGYGAKIRIKKFYPLRGCNSKSLPTQFFVVEDTMHPRWTAKMDVWMPTRNQAINFGRCAAEIEVTTK